MANTAVKQMQQALKVYAQGTGLVAADPGVADGVVGTKTITAVLTMIPLLPGMPSELKVLVPLGPLVLTNADARSRAVKFITSNAGKIHAGIVGLAAYQIAVGQTPQVPGGTVVWNPGAIPPVAPPWYTTWWGIGLITIGAVTIVGGTVAAVRR